MEKKKTLLEKFEIPLHHLDFAYVKDCKDAREMEKIVQILRSGQEGYYPDLMKCAEDKLCELNPNSRLFRCEEKVLTREHLSENEWKPIYDWTKDIKTTDKKLEKLNANKKSDDKNSCDTLADLPVRESGKICQIKEPNSDKKQKSEVLKATPDTKTERIKATEYDKWDKYDADEEIIRLELAEEREQETIEIKNRYNKKTFTHEENIAKIQERDDCELKQLSGLYEFERDKMAEDFRFRGNDYFRCTEYEKAKLEYTKSLKIKTTAYGYNNRAMANLKLGKYLEAINDCDNCLKLDPENVKALLRKAEATYASGKRRCSYILYLKVLHLDPLNTIATKAVNGLREEFGEIPPENATRMQIKEFNSTTSTQQPTSPTKQIQSLKRPNIPPPPPPPPPSPSTISTTTPVAPATAATTAKTSNTKTIATPKLFKPKEYNLADLVKPNPNFVVKNKLFAAAEALNDFKTHIPRPVGTTKPMDMNQNVQTSALARKNQLQDFEMLMPIATAPMNANKLVGKNLIEEI